jgi:hypothetical protein
LVMAAALLGFFGGALAGPSKDRAKDTVDEFNKEMRAVRADHPLLPVNYLEHGHDVYGYGLPRRFVRLARQGDTFRIRKFKTKDTYVRLELETARKTKLSVFIFDNGKLSQVFLDEVFPAVLSELFEFGTPPHRDPFVGNTKSKLVHQGSCNHLPPPGEREIFATLDAARNAGYSLCRACFTGEIILPIEGFAQARAEAVERARLFELVFPPVNDPAVQEEIQSVGESIVEDFPVETAGFDYVFKVVHSALPQAYAFSTGFIYVTDCLLDVVEDPAELRFVLGHEIAHCELLLPPVGRSEPPSKVHNIELSTYQVIRWYQHREAMADLLGVNYLAATDQGGDALLNARSILRKMQFGSGELPSHETDGYGTHPSYASRLNFFDRDRFQPGDTRNIFCGLNKEGDALVRARILGLGRDEKLTRAYVLIEGTDLANETASFPAGGESEWVVGFFKDANGKTWKLYNHDLPFEVAPASVVMAALAVGSDSAFEEVDLSTLQDLEILRIPDVERWTQCPAQDGF